MQEPGHKAIVVDKNDVAWQHWRTGWIGVGEGRHADWEWLEGNRYPIVVVWSGREKNDG